MYRVLLIAEDSTNERVKDGTKSRVVVYVSLANGRLWCRDESEFEEIIEQDGYSGPRFARVPGS